MSTAIILTILFTHWFADFVLQTDEQAKNKSKCNIALTQHVLTYIIPFCFLCLFLFPANPIELFANKTFLFIGITFCAHWLTDYFTSRLNSKLWKAGKVHNFFVSVGFDQFLHYTQLFLTYELLR